MTSSDPNPRQREGSAAVLLAIETSGSSCSAAVARGGNVLAVERRALRHGHAEILLPMIDRIMAAAGLAPAALDAVAVTTGPGGFTGIRVGLAAAHGIAVGTGARLIGVSSFAAIAAAQAASVRHREKALLVALDSRREELYCQLFAPNLSVLEAPFAGAPSELAKYVDGIVDGAGLLLAGGMAASAAVALAERPGTEILSDAPPDAAGVVAAASDELHRGVPAAPLRPLYLRPPDVTLPRPSGPPAASA